jgi:hypothetical protein
LRISKLPSRDVPPEAAERLLGGYFFASPGFARVWAAKGGRAVTWMAEDAGRVAALLPGVEAGHGPLRRFMSMPDGCYGGVFCAETSPADRRRLAAALLDAVAAGGYPRAHVYDFYGSVDEAPSFEVLPCAATVVDLPDASWQPGDPKLRSQIRKAEREGIRVQAFDWDRHHAPFLRLVAASERWHGHPPRYRPAFYEALARLARVDARVHWLWCARDGRAAASHIYFVEHGALQAWQTYFDREFSFLKPNQYMRFALCRALAAQGIRRLNLGATPPGASGLAYYKARWGGSLLSYNSFVRRSPVGRLL